MNKNKYKQIINYILNAIRKGELKQNGPVPSITKISKQFNVARETVVKAYKHLKKTGILESVPAKGFYIRSVNIKEKLRIFLLFDAFTSYKENLYNGLKDGFGNKAELDIYFHHFNPTIFNDLLLQSNGKYHYYIVMPWPNGKIIRTLSNLNQDQLLLLDRDIDFPGKKCSTIHQDFGEELHRVFFENWDLFTKYKSITLVFPPDRHHPDEIQKYFRTLCRKKKFKHKIINKLHTQDIQSGQAYLIIEDYDLVTLIQGVNEKGLRPGKDVGIISYNETLLKKIVENGITVISTDFYELGKKATELILNNHKKQIVYPTHLIYRKTL